MLVRKLAADAPAGDRRRWRIVRLDTHQDLPGEIVEADVENGTATMKQPSGESTQYSLGPGGIAIIGR
jgi:hypothetical protein